MLCILWVCYFVLVLMAFSQGSTLTLATVSDNIVHESFQVDTHDYEDHSFCGKFDIACWLENLIELRSQA